MAHPDRVLVVGGGIAGICAAIELLAAGCAVTLVDRDREERLGGLASESFGGILLVDTPIQRRHGVHDSPALALSDWLRFGGLPAEGDDWPQRWARAYVEQCRVEVHDWLLQLGLRFLPLPQWPERRGNSVPRWHVAWGTGYGLMQCLLARLRQLARRTPLELCFEHRVEHLLVEDGRVVGCAGRREPDARAGAAVGEPFDLRGGAAGEPFELRGAAVLVASGGINGDARQVRGHWPAGRGAPPPTLLNGAHRYADGLLHAAVRAAGGRVSALDRMWNYAAGVRHWAPRRPDHGLSLVPPRGALWLDAHGRRFTPPLLAGQDTGELVRRIGLAGGTSWLVMNRRLAVRELAVSGAEFNPALREQRKLAFLRDTLLGNRWLYDTFTAHCPDIALGDTPSALAAAMNEVLRRDQRDHAAPAIDATALARELLAFDAAMAADAAGGDAQRDNVLEARRWRGDRVRTSSPRPLLARGDGPLLAVHAQLISRKSLGGIVTDLAGRVLDASGNPVPGLYAAGEAAGFGGGGSNGAAALEGTFLGGCIFGGRRAGRAMSQALPT